MSSLNSSSTKTKCLICFSVFHSERCKNPEYFNPIFDVLCRLLEIGLIEPLQWNFEHHGIPFCEFCCSAVEKLKELNDQFELLQQQINHILHITKQTILKSGYVSKNKIIDDLNLMIVERINYLRRQFIVEGSSCHERNDAVNEADNNKAPNVEEFVKFEIQSNCEDEIHLPYPNHINEEQCVVKVEMIENDPLVEAIRFAKNEFVSEMAIENSNNDPDSLFLDENDCDSSIQLSCNTTSNTTTGPEKSTTFNDKMPSVKKKYKCNYCEHMFISSYKLKEHTIIHSGEKPHKCEFCEKRFVRRDYLKFHIRTHTGEKPFKCDLCEKSYTTSSALKNHKVTHASERPYKCEVCDKRFSHSSTLVHHRRLHTGEKPFMCDNCGKTFAHPGSLFSHKKIGSCWRQVVM